MRVTTTIERGPVATMPSDQVNVEFSHLIWTNFSGPDTANLSKFGSALKIAKAAADEAGVRALYYLEEGTPDAAVALARKRFGDGNVVIFPKN